jgi:TDG/mug DNA glycosylase family protein
VSKVHGFPPIAATDARLLILGSMPGKASLRANQYYAHPRNAFWPIVEALFGIHRTLHYEVRCAQLMLQRIAVWDVLKTCTRSSSLDSDIDESSIVANDFPAFFAAHPDIHAIYFNGAMAERSFRRHALGLLPEAQRRLPTVRLPSTSPANASYSFERKLAAWRSIRD